MVIKLEINYKSYHSGNKEGGGGWGGGGWGKLLYQRVNNLIVVRKEYLAS